MGSTAVFPDTAVHQKNHWVGPPIVTGPIMGSGDLVSMSIVSLRSGAKGINPQSYIMSRCSASE